MAYSSSKNPRERFCKYSSNEEFFNDILKTFPKKSPSEKIATNLATIFPANRDYRRAAKNSILTVIAAVTLTVIAYIIFCLIATPEKLVKDEIASITSDYYENYFYNSILENNSLSQEDTDFNAPAMEEILKNYSARGFADITLRQLLLYDDQKHSAATEYLSKYCNLDSSRIKIYPEAPYKRQDYHVDYNYSCKF